MVLESLYKIRAACAVFILLLIPLSFAITPLTYEEACFTDITEYLPLIGLAASITIVLIAITYMLSHLLQRVELGVWAKDELVHLGISIVLILCVVGAFQVGCGITYSYAGKKDPFTTATDYLDELAIKEGLSIVSSLLQESYATQLEATASMFIGFPIAGGYGIAYHANKKIWAQQKNLMADMLMPFIISLKIQKMALEMIKMVGVPVLLPLALLLRVFPLTRDTGNMLIALSFGLYVIFPLTYVLNAQAAKGIVQDPMEDKIVDFSRIGKIIPQAVLFPNISIIILVTFVQALNKALRSIAA